MIFAMFGIGPIEILILCGCCGIVLPALIIVAVYFAVKASRKDRDRG